MSEFQAILDDLTELDELRKAQPTAQPVAAKHPEPDEDNEGGPSDHDEDNEDEDEDEYEDDDEDEDEEDARDSRDGKPFGKSFGVTLPDGSYAEAMDGTAVIAALQSDLAALSGDMRKALGTILSVAKSQAAELDTLRKSQAADIDALRSQVDALNQRPAGRKSKLNIHERPSVLDDAPAAEPAMDRAAIMAKAVSMQLDPVTMGVVCECVNRGLPLPDQLRKALS